MHINGAHINHFILQNRGTGVRPSEVAQSLNTPRNLGGAPRMPDAEAGQSREQTFANEIARRAKAHTDANGAPKNTGPLASALSKAMDHLRENYGDDVATAAEGMVMGGTAGGITEKNLGDSLTNVLRMVDRNFGFAAGDATMAHFNGSLNTAINDFFDNGKTERFLAAEPGQGLSLSAVKSDLNARVLAETDTNSAKSSDGMEQLLRSLREDLEQTPESPSAGQPTRATDSRRNMALNSYLMAATGQDTPGPQLLSTTI